MAFFIIFVVRLLITRPPIIIHPVSPHTMLAEREDAQHQQQRNSLLLVLGVLSLFHGGIFFIIFVVRWFITRPPNFSTAGPEHVITPRPPSFSTAGPEHKITPRPPRLLDCRSTNCNNTTSPQLLDCRSRTTKITPRPPSFSALLPSTS